MAPSLLAAMKGLPPPASAPPGEPSGHFATPLHADDLARVKALGQGQSMRDLPEHFWHESYRRRAFRRVQDGTPTDNRGGAPYGLRRLFGDHPSKAVTSGSRAEFVHPLEDRYLTMRECARIQTFPDTFEFVGAMADQTLVVGNAVPPMLGEVLGRSLAQDLRRATPKRHRGALLSFVPTLSSGMSPALERVVDRVSAKFGETEAAKRQLVLGWHG
jgi:DNA (cytosine-5)-methyltransferase 1